MDRNRFNLFLCNVLCIAALFWCPCAVAQDEAFDDSAEEATEEKPEVSAPAPAKTLPGTTAVKQPMKKNLLSNGSFDNPEDALAGWRYKYDLEGETQWYGDNHKHVDVVKEFKGRKNVVRFWGDVNKINERGEGVKMDSEMIPYEHGARYRLSTWVCTTGPDCRVYIEGWHWKPGIKPDHAPIWGEVRHVYKGKVMRLDSKDGAFSGAPKMWKQGFVEFPTEKASELSMKHMKVIKFITVHLIAIGGSGGETFFDDVVLERIK